MKRERFSIEQIVTIVKQAEMGMPVAELIRRVGISEQTFYRWKKQFTGLEIDQVRQLKQLQDDELREECFHLSRVASKRAEFPQASLSQPPPPSQPDSPFVGNPETG